MKRRSFFTRTGLLAAGALSAPALARAAGDATARAGERPRHIIHFVVDGMSQGTLSCAEHLSQLTRQRGLNWLAQYNEPTACTGLVNVRSLNSLVTDSAASASAWGSGSRVVNGALNMLPDGRELKPLYQLFNEQGWKRGLVTTTEITHATPAGFSVNVRKRSEAETIAAQMLERRIDVLLGGGSKFFLPATRKDKRDLPAEFAKAGYAVMRELADLEKAATDQRWLGLFTPSHLPYSLDRATDATRLTTVPTLAAMVSAALRKLEREEHFILQVEGGRVDHAAHLNDGASAFHDMIAADNALAVCLKFQAEHPDTLLVMTTDHGTGNPGLNGTGGAYGQTSALFAQVANIRHSHEWMLRCIFSVPEGDPMDLIEAEPQLSGLVEPKRLAEIIESATAFKMPEAQAQTLHSFFAGKGNALYPLANSGEFQLAQWIAGNTGVGWTSLNHTSDFVPIIARGPGAERFRGFIQNVEIFRNYTQLAGIDFQNPSVPLLANHSVEAPDLEWA